LVRTVQIVELKLTSIAESEVNKEFWLIKLNFENYIRVLKCMFLRFLCFELSTENLALGLETNYTYISVFIMNHSS
jgi:hypothetical protein